MTLTVLDNFHTFLQNFIDFVYIAILYYIYNCDNHGKKYIHCTTGEVARAAVLWYAFKYCSRNES